MDVSSGSDSYLLMRVPVCTYVLLLQRNGYRVMKTIEYVLCNIIYINVKYSQVA